MGIEAIRPVTISITSRELYVHLLHAGRLLLLPEHQRVYERGFARSLARLIQARCGHWPVMPRYACWNVSFGRSRFSSGGASTEEPPARLISAVPPLELDWPRESPIREVTVSVYQQPPLDPLYVTGNLLEIII